MFERLSSQDILKYLRQRGKNHQQLNATAGQYIDTTTTCVNSFAVADIIKLTKTSGVCYSNMKKELNVWSPSQTIFRSKPTIFTLMFLFNFTNLQF